MNSILYIKDRFKNDRGFTLIEVLIVIAIISLMSLFVAPRISNFFGSARGSFIILTNMIAKTFDDSFINERLNFMVIHLSEPGEDTGEDKEDIFSHTNGVSVVNLNEEGIFKETSNKLLKYKEFPDYFILEEVLISTGETITNGNVLIPFYPQGYSDNVILHILVNNEERWSVRIYKLQKEAEIFRDYIEF
ncbi:MAG: type II secretion system protein [Spirochaetota bacterium]|nr:type II secretion system protein [Spirochaetota bacterium]